MIAPIKCPLLAALALVTSVAAADLDHDAYIKSSNTKFFTHFGQSLAISGSTLVVGSPLEKSGSRRVNGERYGTSTGLTRRGSEATLSGVGGRGLGQVIVSDGSIIVIIKGKSSQSEVIRLSVN